MTRTQSQTASDKTMQSSNSNPFQAPPSYNGSKVSRISGWATKVTPAMSYEEFSEFFVETIVRESALVQHAITKDEEVIITVKEDLFNNVYPGAAFTKIGDLRVQIRLDSSGLFFPDPTKSQSTIYVIWARYNSELELKGYRAWLENVRKVSPQSPVIYVRCHTNDKGDWQSGFKSGESDTMDATCAKLATICMDDNPNDAVKLYKVISRFALLSVLEEREKNMDLVTVGDTPEDYEGSVIPAYIYMEKKSFYLV